MKQILFNDLKYKEHWQLENEDGSGAYKSGMIYGKLFYTSFIGNITHTDAQQLDEVLDKIYDEGHFRNSSIIRIIDFSELNGISSRGRRHYIKTVKHLNQKYNCAPSVSYICSAPYWLKSTIFFAEKFLAHKFVFVSTVAEAFELINKRKTFFRAKEKNTVEKESVITIPKEEIDKIFHLTNSVVWGTSDNNIEQFSIPESSPLYQLYQFIQIMISDKEEMLVSEKNISEERKNSLLQQKLLANISFEFNKLEKFEDKMNKVLNLIGKFINTSRIYVFEDIDNGASTKNTFEWCNVNITPLIDNNHVASYKIVPSFKNILIEEGIFFSENIDELPQDLIDIIKPQKIKSILCLPIYVKKQFFGFIGFDECERKRKWAKNEIELLRTVANIISTITERRTTEMILRKSEEQHRTIIESTSEGCWVIDSNHITIDVNNSMCEMIGYTRDEMIGKTPIDFVDEENAKIFISQAQKIPNVFNRKYEITIKSKSDTDVFVIVNSTTLYDKEGEVIKSFAFVTDITESVKSKTALIESEEKFKAISSSANDGIVLMDNLGNVSYWNRAAEKIFGYSEDEIIGKNLHELLTPQKYRNIQNKAFASFRNTGKGDALGKTVEVEGIRKNGEVFPIELSLSPLKINGLWNAVGMVKDITERKKSENALRESKNLYKNVFDNSPLGIIHYGANGVITDCNNRFAQIIGVTRDELVGVNLLEALQNKILKKAIKDTLKQGSGYYEGNYSSKTVSKITPIECHFKAIYDVNKNILGVVGLVEDITERKMAEHALKETEEQYSSLLENLNDIIFEIDLNSKILFVNPIAEKIIEKPYNEIISTPFHEFYDKRSQLKIYNIYNKLLENYKTDKTLKDKAIKLELKLTNDKIIFIRTTPIISENGEIIGHRGIGREITEQKKAEQALLESEEKFRILFEKSDDAILVIDEGKFVDCNQSVVDMLGYSNKKELLNIHPSQLSPWKQPDGELSFQKAEKMMKTALIDGSNHFEWIHIRANGKEFPVEIWLTAIPYKGREIIHTVWRDITERKKREKELKEYRNNLEKLVNVRTEELIEHQEKLEDIVEERTLQFQQSEARYRSLLDNSNDAIMRFDKNLRHLYVSPSIKRLTGLSPEKFRGKTREELGFPKELNEKWNSAIRKVFSSKIKNRLEFELPNNKWIDWSLVPEFNEKGEVESVLTSARDITERKKDEGLLRVKTEELEMFNKTMLNREMRMIELKEEVNELAEKFEQKPPYQTIWKDIEDTKNE